MSGSAPGRVARTLTAAASAVAILIAGACSEGRITACPATFTLDYVSVFVAPGVRSDLASIRLELCQGDECKRATFPATPRRGKPRPAMGESVIIADQVELIGEGTYTVDLGVFGLDWDPDAKTRLDFRGLSAEGATILRHEESFAFHKNNAGLSECQPDPHLSHKTRVGPADLVHRPS